MARISTYPIISTPTLNDLLIGTDVEDLNITKNFTIGDISSLIIGGNYVPYVGATGDVNLGAFDITASSFIVGGGLASQFLKADGSLDSTVYQPAGNYITQLSGEATASGPGNATVTLSNSAVINKVLTGLNITGTAVVATDSILTAFGKVQNQINTLVGGVQYKGTWNAATNTPTLQSSVGVQGNYYVVSVAGSTNLNGITDWKLGDWAIFNGSAWEKVDNTDAVISVNGQVGAVVLTTTDIAEGTNLYYTDLRSRSAISLTTTGNSGAATYNYTTGIFNIPNYTLGGLGGVPTTRTLTINGTAFDLSADRSWSVGTVTSIATTGPLTGGTITGSGTIGITQAGASSDGYLSSTDWNTFNNKQNAITNPVTGTGTPNTLPMWGSTTSLVNSPLSYAADAFNFQYNSATGGTVNFTNIGLTAYTYSIQMNNFGSPRSTVHSYTDGLVIQFIGGTQVSRMFANGNMILGTGTVDNGYKLELSGTLALRASASASAATQVPVFIADPSGTTRELVTRTPAQLLGDAGGVTGTGVAGQVAFWNGTSSQTGDNKLTFNSSTGLLTLDKNLTLEQLRFNDGESYLGVSNDVRNWYLTGKNFSITTEESTPTGLFFKPDGTRFYILGTSVDRVRAYDMSIPWDVTTAIIAESFSVPEATSSGLFFKSDGTVLYIVGTTTDLVRQFTLPTPWILTGAIASGTFNVGTQDASPTDLYISPDGVNMYVAGDTTPDKVIQYILSTPWNVTTSTFLQTFSVSAQESGVTALSFNEDGTRMYILGTTGDDITEYRLSVPWDISTSVYFSESFTFTQESTPNGLYYNQNENKAYVLGTGIDTVIGLGTTKQLKIYGDSVTTDSQMYVGGRFETRAEAYFNGPITTLGAITGGSTLTVASNIVGLNISTSSTNATLGTATGTTTLNLGGGNTTSTNRFAYGATLSGSRKNIEIGTSGLSGSFTSAAIGTIISDGLFSFRNNAFFNEPVFINTNLSKTSPTGATVVLDTFTEASNTLLNLHTPDVGSGWTRVQIGAFTTPTFTVFGSTDTMGPTSSVTDQGVIYTQDTILTNSNYEVSVGLIVQDSAEDVMWLFARYQDSDNWYGVKWSTTAANCLIVKKVAGVFTTLSGLSATPITGVSSLTLRVYGNNILVLNGGIPVMGAIDDSITSAGYAGIGAGNIGQLSTDDFENWRFDNFTVTLYEIENSLIVLDVNGKGRFQSTLKVGSNTSTDTSSVLDVESTTQGFLSPRMTTLQRDAIATPATGLQIYNTTSNTIDYYNGTAWTSSGGFSLTTIGSSGPATLVGSTLNIPDYTTDLSGYVTLGTAQTITAQKTFTGSGSSDTMIISHGSGSGFALDVIKGGSGEAIRVTKTSGSGNAMSITGGNFGAEAATFSGVVTTTADAVVNTISIGLGAGSVSNNTRVGLTALNSNTTGSSNSAFGNAAGRSNTEGLNNSFFGRAAGESNSTASNNSYFGAVAGNANNGGNNVFFGREAGSLNTTGTSNAFVGHRAGNANTTGGSNLFLGASAGTFVAAGTNNSITNNSIYLGFDTRANADNQTNQIVIGHAAIGLGSNTTVIGNSSTTFGRWFGNLLVGSSTNSGQMLQVTGTSLLNGLSTIQGTTASDSGQLGSELTTTGSGTNWTGTSFATGYTHAVGSTVPLSTSLVATNGIYYQIAYTITGRTAGSITISYGGVSTSGITATGATGPRAISTVPLSIVPTTDFDGTLVLSIKVISTSSASVTFNSSAGTTTNQIRISSINSNTFVGRESGRNNTTATNNSFFGAGSGQSNTTGGSNSFFGNASGQANITGGSNSFFGSSSGLNNTTGSSNSFFGVSVGQSNTTGSNNSFFGISAGAANTTGGVNSFFGLSAGVANTTGNNNTFFGALAGNANTTASQNTVIGTEALSPNTTGANNTALGRNAGRYAGTGTTNMTSVNNSIYLGFQTRGLNATGTTNEVVIGYDVVGLGSNTTVLGNSSTTFGRWFGNLLVGTSTNNGTNLRVVGTTQSDTITQNLASHGRKVLQYTSVSSTTINLPTEFPLMTGLVVSNSYAVFGKFLGKYVNYGQAIEFYISKNPNGMWNTVAYSNSSQFIAALVSVTGSGDDLTITTNTGTSFILELTVMTQS